MKIIEVRRHSKAEKWEDLTPEGRAIAEETAERLEKFYHFVISSPKKRAQETLIAMGFEKFDIDESFGTLPGDELAYYEQRIQKIIRERDLTLLGAYFSLPETRTILMNHGWKFIEGLRKIVTSLPKMGKALIISHGGSIEPAILTVLGGESLDGIGGELGYCEGARFVFDEENTLKTVEVLRL